MSIPNRYLPQLCICSLHYPILISCTGLPVYDFHFFSPTVNGKKDAKKPSFAAPCERKKKLSHQSSKKSLPSSAPPLTADNHSLEGSSAPQEPALSRVTDHVSPFDDSVEGTEQGGALEKIPCSKKSRRGFTVPTAKGAKLDQVAKSPGSLSGHLFPSKSEGNGSNKFGIDVEYDKEYPNNPPLVLNDSQSMDLDLEVEGSQMIPESFSIGYESDLFED